MKSLLSDLVAPRTYRRISYLVLAFPLGTAYFCVLVTLLSSGLGLAITLLGIPVLIGALYVWRWLAQMERGLVGALLDVDIRSPYRPDREERFWRRLAARVADPATWKDLIYLFLEFPLGIFTFVATICLIAVPLGLLFMPAWYWSIPDGVDVGVLNVDTLTEAVAMVPVGALTLPLGVRLLNLIAASYGWFARIMLGSSPDPELTARVVDLRDSRARIIEAGDAERRRLERDLHDGAQQRLVSLSLNIAMARKRLDAGDEAAADLLAAADEEARLALTELRDLARGIHPAVLTDRGLAAALDDLAARAPVPVEVIATPDGRLPAAVEAAAYFAVSEALANVAKYAQAGRVTIEVASRGDVLVAEVRDDGLGGADPEAGSGLRGLADRMNALDGELEIQSPPGGGTLVRATLPLGAGPAPVPEPAVVGEGVLDERSAALIRLRRKRAFQTHAAVLAVVMGVEVLIWGLTSRAYFWPIWTLVGWLPLLAIHAWVAFGRAPITESAVQAELAGRSN